MKTTGAGSQGVTVTLTRNTDCFLETCDDVYNKNESVRYFLNKNESVRYFVVIAFFHFMSVKAHGHRNSQLPAIAIAINFFRALELTSIKSFECVSADFQVAWHPECSV
jgi:hypothetical protein